MEHYYFANPSINLAPSGSWSSSYTDKEQDKNKKKGGGAAGKKSSKAVKLSTDPQSIAARERRQRIRERFKTLQSLVPGGSKMDTASMLEEAVHYVHFLKNQIRFHQSLLILNNNNSPSHCNDNGSVLPRSGDLSLPCSCTNYGDYVAEADEVGRLGFNDDFTAQMQPPLTLPETCFRGQESHVFW